MERTIEYDAMCESCKGTGVYVGMAERDGAGVVCNACNGKGQYHAVITYQDPETRRHDPRVKRVYQINPGVCIGASKDGKFTLEQFGGMPYEDWEKGKPFPPKSENRDFTCPAWWYQSADYKKKPDWKECGWGSFSACQHFPNKSKCWERWDKEFGKQKSPAPR